MSTLDKSDGLLPLGQNVFQTFPLPYSDERRIPLEAERGNENVIGNIISIAITIFGSSSATPQPRTITKCAVPIPFVDTVTPMPPPVLPPMLPPIPVNHLPRDVPEGLEPDFGNPHHEKSKGNHCIIL